MLENAPEPGQHHPNTTEPGGEDAHLPAGQQHQHVEGETYEPEGDLSQGLRDGGQHQHVAVSRKRKKRQAVCYVSVLVLIHVICYYLVYFYHSI